ncbi:MAG: hypothetical protein WAM30_08395 [Candidatus Dormiibacterota bacterium]
MSCGRRDRRDPQRLGVLLVALLLLAACSNQPVAHHSPATPTRTATPTPAPTPSIPACASAQTAATATGVSSPLPVLQLAAGLDEPEDVLVAADAIYVGEFGNGKIDAMPGLAGAPQPALLPVTIPEVEGIAFIGTTMYVADQLHDRVVTVSGGQVQTFLQLQPVPGVEGVDSVFADGQSLVVPDSPRGDVLIVGTDGQIQHTLTGFARPVGGWVLTNGQLAIPDENRGAVIAVDPASGAQTLLAGGLSLADDVVQDSGGRIYAISIDQGRVVSIAGGAAQDVASGLQQPQGLGIDAANNLVVTEYTIGRVDLVVTTFKLLSPAAAAPALGPGQPLCVQLTRAPGYATPISIAPGPGYRVVQQPGTGTEGSVEPVGCSGACQVEVRVDSGTLHDTVLLGFQAPAPTATPTR